MPTVTITKHGLLIQDGPGQEVFVTWNNVEDFIGELTGKFNEWFRNGVR